VLFVLREREQSTARHVALDTTISFIYFNRQ